jgi:DNA-binding ferritin-like protein (Dps family)
MLDIFKKIIGEIKDKKEWNAIEARAKTLPHDYLVVYNKIKQYLWSGAGPLSSSIDLFKGLLELFEEGAANGKPVLEITGKDVAAFCDELVRGEKTYAESLREKINRDIMKELRKG